MYSAEARAVVKEAGKKQETHRAEIVAAGAILGLDGPTVEQWIEYALPLSKFTHRASLAGPRDVAEFREHFADGQAVLLAVLRRLETVYVDARPLVRELAATSNPRDDDLSTLTNRVPHSTVVLGEFFSLANLGWFGLLREAGYFGAPEPLVPDEEGRIAYVEWPPARFLTRAAAAPELQHDVVEILSALETDNPEARDATVEAALEMPAPLAAQLAKRIAGYVKESLAWWVPRHSEELVMHLVDGGEVATALDVTRALLASQPHGSDWRMRHAFTDLVPKLFPAAGIDGLAMLRDMLAEELTDEGRETDDLSTIWRESIGGGHDMRRRDLLVTALNRAGDSLLASDAGLLRDVVATLAGDDRAIFKRIALHRIAEHPDAEIAAEWLGDETVFRSQSLEREYAELAQAAFATLDPDVRTETLGWIDAGPTWRPRDLDERETADFDDHWRLRRLRALPALPPDWQVRYETLVERFGDPGDPLRASRVPVWSGTRSPIEKDQLLALSDDAVLDFVDTWESGDDWEGPTGEGLANALREAAIEAPHRFSDLLPAFVEQRPLYARQIVYGLQQVVQNGGAISWAPVLRFARGAIGRTGGEGDSAEEDSTWTWARIETLRLLLYGLTARTIPMELGDEVWQVIAPLTDDPDPTVESEDEHEAGGSTVELQALNRVRSQAVEAVIRFAAWRRAEAGAEAPRKLPDEVRVVLDQRVDPERERTRTVGPSSADTSTSWSISTRSGRRCTSQRSSRRLATARPTALRRGERSYQATVSGREAGTSLPAGTSRRSTS
jgi:hypothetical protein